MKILKFGCLLSLVNKIFEMILGNAVENVK